MDGLLSQKVPDALAQQARAESECKIIEAEAVEAIAEIRRKLHAEEKLEVADIRMIVVYFREFRKASHSRNKTTSKKRKLKTTTRNIKNNPEMAQGVLDGLDDLIGKGGK